MDESLQFDDFTACAERCKLHSNLAEVLHGDTNHSMTLAGI